jgi:hypothetical protein
MRRHQRRIAWTAKLAAVIDARGQPAFIAQQITSRPRPVIPAAGLALDAHGG